MKLLHKCHRLVAAACKADAVTGGDQIQAALQIGFLLVV
jgi:hypothetical protein